MFTFYWSSPTFFFSNNTDWMQTELNFFICFMLILFVCLFWDTLFPKKVGHGCFKGFWKIFREAWKGELLQILLHFLRIEVVVGAFLKSIHQIAQRLPLNICGASWSFSPTTYLWSIWAIMPRHWTPSIDKCVINFYWKCKKMCFMIIDLVWDDGVFVIFQLFTIFRRGGLLCIPCIMTRGACRV